MVYATLRESVRLMWFDQGYGRPSVAKAKPKATTKKKTAPKSAPKAAPKEEPILDLTDEELEELRGRFDQEVFFAKAALKDVDGETTLSLLAGYLFGIAKITEEEGAAGMRVKGDAAEIMQRLSLDIARRAIAFYEEISTARPE
jgi:hypothetical protein